MELIRNLIIFIGVMYVVLISISDIIIRYLDLRKSNNSKNNKTKKRR